MIGSELKYDGVRVSMMTLRYFLFQLTVRIIIITYVSQHSSNMETLCLFSNLKVCSPIYPPSHPPVMRNAWYVSYVPLQKFEGLPSN